MKLEKYKPLLAVAIVAALLSCLPTGCVQEPVYLSDSSARLQFSTDTLSFDTVFTTLGTTTRTVKVYNPYSQDIMLSKVSLRGGKSSRFRINTDGNPNLTSLNVEISAHDSIFIFVQANIDPNSSSTPFLVSDAIDIQIKGGATQSIQLAAWGRNAVYHQPDTAGRAYALDCAAWDHTRPHVIFGAACIDSLQTLNLLPGEELHFATDGHLLVLDGASLVVQGSADAPVLFGSLRHDGWYSFLPGQWGYIHLMAGSHDNVIDHAVIENAYIGLVADTNVGANPTLRISNTVVRHMSEGGLVGRGAWIDGRNLLVHTCGTATLALQWGGRYTLSQSTFANYWRYGSRQNPGVILGNWYMSASGDTVARNLMEATFTDCIIYGSYDKSEVLLEQHPAADFNYRFIHSLVKGGEWNDDPRFVDVENEDFHLEPDSPATGIGYQYNDQE